MKFINIVSSCAAIAAVSCASTPTPAQQVAASMETFREKIFTPMMNKKGSDFEAKCNRAKPGKETIEVILKDVIVNMVDRIRLDTKWPDILREFAKVDGLAGEISKEALAQAAGNKEADLEAVSKGRVVLEAIFQSIKEQPDRYVAAIDAALKSDAKDKPADHKAIVDAVFKEFKKSGSNIWYWVAGISGGFIVVVGAGTLVYFLFVRPKNHF